MVPLQNCVWVERFPGTFACGETSPGNTIAKSLQKKTPHKTVKDKCQLCYTTWLSVYSLSILKLWKNLLDLLKPLTI